MAKNVTAQDTKPSNVDKMPQASRLKSIMEDVKAADGRAASARMKVAGIMANAEARDNLNNAAFTLTKRQLNKEPAQLYAFLKHFDHYRVVFKLDDIAGESLFEAAEKVEAEAEKKETKAKKGGSGSNGSGSKEAKKKNGAAKPVKASKPKGDKSPKADKPSAPPPPGPQLSLDQPTHGNA